MGGAGIGIMKGRVEDPDLFWGGGRGVNCYQYYSYQVYRVGWVEKGKRNAYEKSALVITVKNEVAHVFAFDEFEQLSGYDCFRGVMGPGGGGGFVWGGRGGGETGLEETVAVGNGVVDSKSGVAG